VFFLPEYKEFKGLNYSLHSIGLDFGLLVLSEVWNYNLDFCNHIFKTYTFYYKAVNGTNVGGVKMYIKNTFKRNELAERGLTSYPDRLWL